MDTTAKLYDALAQAHRDIELHRNLLALLPWTVHVDHQLERAIERATLLARIPAQRQRPLDLRPATRPGVAPRGVPARPHTQWGKRS